MIRQGKRTLIALDLLRFACAMMVVAFHYGLGFPLLPPPGGAAMLAGMPVDHDLIPFVNSGWIGVELFFVISGYVIASSAEGVRAATFLGRRALRLAPAAWLCSSLTALALAAWSAMPASEILRRWSASAAFWPMIPPIDPSYWTLGVEANFYLLMAAALLGGSGIARIERVGIALGCASLAYWATSLLVEIPSVMNNRPMQLALLPHGCFFALGILLRVRQRCGSSPTRLALLLLFAAAAAIEIGAHRRDLLGQQVVHVPALLLFALGLLPILFAQRWQPWLERHVSASLAVTLGLMTYPLYLLHHELGAMTIGLLMRQGIGFLPAAALALAICLGLAWLIAAICEPWLRAGLRRLGHRASAGAVPLGQVPV